MKRHIFSLLIILVIVLLQQTDLFSSGFFPMHDDTQVARVVVMGRALRNGQFPVRWVDTLGYGYGYPIFNFYGPLPYYVGGVLYAVGFSGLTATKFMILLGSIVAAWSMYYLIAHYWRRTAGIVAAVFYSFALYHAVQIFVRGAIGEYWVTAFFPVLCLGILEILYYKPKRGILLGIFGSAGIILSHTLLGYASMLFWGISIGVYALFCILTKRSLIRVRSLSLAFLGGLALSSFFWLPAFVEMRFTDVASQVSATAQYMDHFICPLQLWNATWGFGGSALGCIDGLSFALGKVLLLGALLGVGSYVVVSGVARRLIIIAVVISVVSILFTLSVSAPVWSILPFFPFLQYPWRFLALSIFGLSVLSGIGIISVTNRWARIIAGAVLVILCIGVNNRWFHPQYTYPASDASFETDDDIRWRVSKISDEYLPPDLPRPRGPNEVVHDTIVRHNRYIIKTVIDRETYKKYEITTTNNEEIQVNIAAFPGWHYVVNGKTAVYRIANGIVFVKVPSGFSTMEFSYNGTAIQLLGNILSAVTIIGIIYLYGKKTIT